MVATRAENVETESLSDVGRLLAVIAAAEEIGHPLTTAELEAACYLLQGMPEGGLRFSYSFRFAPRPRSEQLYEQLMALEDAKFARRASPLRIQDLGRSWLSQPAWAKEADGARLRAVAGLKDLLGRDGDLIRLSVTRASGS